MFTFSWSDSTGSYGSNIFIPHVEFDPQNMRGQVIPTLDNGVFIAVQTDAVTFTLPSEPRMTPCANYIIDSAR